MLPLLQLLKLLQRLPLTLPLARQLQPLVLLLLVLQLFIHVLLTIKTTTTIMMKTTTLHMFAESFCHVSYY